MPSLRRQFWVLLTFSQVSARLETSFSVSDIVAVDRLQVTKCVYE
jgi:hypothetical protein